MMKSCSCGAYLMEEEEDIRGCFSGCGVRERKRGEYMAATCCIEACK